MLKPQLFILFVLICFSACGHEIVKDTNEYDSTAYHIAILPIEECDAFRKADSLGLFDSLGVKVQLLEYESLADADTALLSDYVQMMVCDTVHTEYLNNEMPVKQVMGGTLYLSLMTSKESMTYTIYEIKDKLFACARNSASWFVMNEIVSKADLQQKNINRPLINNIRIRTDMLLSNQYDGAVLPEPWATMCEKKGAKRVFRSRDINPYLLSVIVPEHKWSRDEKKIEKILKAYKLASK